jgi:hypothetical protein
MSTYHTFLPCEFLGEPAAVIDYDYESGEPEVLYPNDLAHPGCPESVEINSIVTTIAGTEIEVLGVPSDFSIQELELEILEHLRSQGEEEC